MNGALGEVAIPPHPRSVGWLGASSLAMGGSNQSLFLLGAVLATQGSAAVPLLIAGLLLSWAAAPGWLELVLMWPNRVGGIAATCAEAFRPYSPVLANLTGVCYWWGWVPTCGLTALLTGSALNQWYLPGIPTPVLAVAVVVAFTLLNLMGVRRVSRVAIPLAAASASLAFLSAIVPVVTGQVNWHSAVSFHLDTPFAGAFGAVTSAMAGLYLIGFAAPAFEAATCHVGEMRNPTRTMPRAMWVSAGMASVYFIALPVIWLGIFGPTTLQNDLTTVLGPTFAPLLGGLGRSAAVWFMVTNMLHGTLQPLAGASRTLSQLSEDGLLPRTLARRSRTDCPWVATVLTASVSIVFLLAGDPIWMLAAANLTYLISIALPSVAVWLLRRDAPHMHRPFRAPRGTIVLGVMAGGVWLLSTVLGFRQFGLPTVLFGLGLAYSGSLLYGWRVWMDRRRDARRTSLRSIHLKLTGAMLFVLGLDGAGYLLAVTNLSGPDQQSLVAVCEDVFVAVALLTISVGLILPGMIGHAVSQIAAASRRLAEGTLADLTRAMEALGRGDFAAAHADVDVQPVIIHSRDEMHAMATDFNTMQQELVRAASALDAARDQLLTQRNRLEDLAFRDHLTGLATRAVLQDRAEHALARWRRNGEPVAIMAIDLDGFKAINDKFGHSAGDAALHTVAQLLTRTIRSTDTAARMGGDEFAILLEGTDAAQACEAAARIVASLRAPIDLQGSEVYIDASIGIAVTDGDEVGGDELLQRADLAAYEAKNHDGSWYELYLPGMRSTALDRIQLLTDLRLAVQREELVLHYQPIVDLESGRISGLEALVRWQHPTRGLVPPDRFIPAAEASGQIVSIGRWVLSEACRQLVRWRHLRAKGEPPLYLSVNASARELREGTFVGHVLDTLRETGARAEELVVEVTESSLVVDVDEARFSLDRLRAAGIRIAMDDFGAGYSSLGYLRNLPIDIVKIDRMFVTDLATSVEDRSMAMAIVRLLGTVAVRTVAEGIETREQLDVLHALGVDYGQGFLLSRPVEATRIATLLAGDVFEIVSHEPAPRSAPAFQAGAAATTEAAPAPPPPGSTSMPIRVIVVDDAEDVRVMVEAMLGHVEGLNVVGTAADGRAAVEVATAARPDVVLLDVNMPGMGGLEAMPLIRACCPSARIILLTGVGPPSSADGERPADAYLAKGARLTDMVAEIRRVSGTREAA